MESPNGVEWSCDTIQDEQSINLHEDKGNHEGSRCASRTVDQEKGASVNREERNEGSIWKKGTSVDLREPPPGFESLTVINPEGASIEKEETLMNLRYYDRIHLLHSLNGLKRWEIMNEHLLQERSDD